MIILSDLNPTFTRTRGFKYSLVTRCVYPGFCAWSEPSYTYYQRGEQKWLEQTKRRGRRLSIVGLLQQEVSFVYGLVIGGVDRKAYIKMMEQEAQQAAQIGRPRVIVQDNGPIHRCQEVQQL